jgi:hypothetical protein
MVAYGKRFAGAVAVAETITSRTWFEIQLSIDFNGDRTGSEFEEN